MAIHIPESFKDPKCLGAWIEVDLGLLEENYQKLSAYYQDKTIFPVVKANAYGHGMLEIARFYEQLGLPILCVSHLSEAKALIDGGIQTDILIFGWTDPKLMQENNHPQIIYTLSSPYMYEQIKEQSQQYRFHIKMNSGMNRVGFKSIATIKKILAEGKHQYEGIYTHLPSNEDMDINHALFKDFLSSVKSLDKDFRWIHTGNTFPRDVIQSEEVNALRIGMALYGYDKHHDLDPILSLYAPIEYVTSLEKGESVGYDFTYRSSGSEWIASIPLGYAHGFFQEQEHLNFKVEDQELSLVGKVCMDQSMLRMDKRLQEGTMVTIYGKERSVIDLSLKINKSHYELLTQLSPFIPREYIDKESK